MSGDVLKNTGDVASLAIAGATLLDWLPAVAALFTIVWTGIRIYESRTVQALLSRRRKREIREE